jgi:CSLREA domain-containing protein
MNNSDITIRSSLRNWVPPKIASRVYSSALLLILALFPTLGEEYQPQPVPTSPSTNVVNSLSDVAIGSCGGVCTLRDAISLANAGGGSITFSPGLSGTIILTSRLPAITGTLSVDGNGSNITISGNGANQVLGVNAGGALHVQSVTISNGSGGAIRNMGSLTLTRVTMIGNIAQSGSGGGINSDGRLAVFSSTFVGNSAANGGGIHINGYSGSLYVESSAFLSNTASTYAGGGISSYYGSISVTRSTFEANASVDGGGGIYSGQGALSVFDSTFSRNRDSGWGGGGGVSSAYGMLTISNSTFFSNTATYGGGIKSFHSQVTVNSSTFWGNRSGWSGGGGIENNGVLALKNSIFGNSSTSGDCVNFYGTTTGNNNLFSDLTNTCDLTATGNLIGVSPQLGPLANNGGSTLTMLPSPGSPAIDAGSGSECPSFDQRGISRPQGDSCDIGAVESIPTSVFSITPSSRPADGVAQANIRLSGTRANQPVRFSSNRGGGIDQISPARGTTNASGVLTATISSRTPGPAYISAIDPATGQNLAIGASEYFTSAGNPLPPPVTGTLLIQDVTTDFRLDGAYPSNAPDVWSAVQRFYPPGSVHLPSANRVRVAVNWQGHSPGKIEVRRSGALLASAAAADADMRTDLVINLLQGLPTHGPSTIEVIAIDATGQYRGSRAFAGVAYALPDKLVQLMTASVAGLVGHNSSFNYDALKREGQLDLEVSIPSTALTNVADLVFDKSKIGWENLQVNGTLSLSFGGDQVEVTLGKTSTLSEKRLAATGYVKPQKKSMTGAIDILKTRTSLDVSGGLGLTVQPAGDLLWTTVSGHIALTVDYTEKYGILVILKAGDFIAPGAGTTLYNLAKPFDDRLQAYAYAYVKPSLTLGGDGTFDIVNGKFAELSVSGGAGLEIGLAAELKGLIEMGGSIGLEGDSRLFLIPLGCVELTTSGYGRLWLHTLVYDNEVQGRAELKVTSNPGNASCDAGLQAGSSARTATQWQALPSDSTAWRIAGGGYDAKTYAKAVATTTRRQRLAPSMTMTESVLLSNVFTYTQPSMAALPGAGALAIWTHDVLTRPLGQNTDIAFARWDGSDWQSVGRVSDDPYMDSGPRLSATGTGAVAVWTRVNIAALPPTSTLDLTTTRQTEIASSIYVSETGAWSPPVLLTVNDAADYGAVVAGANDGSAWSAWIENPSGQLPGTADAPDALMLSHLSGTGWSAPVVLTTELSGLGQIALATAPGVADLVFAQTVTASNGISQVSRLFRATFSGAAWSAPIAVTPDIENSSAPQVFYAPDGTLRVVFLLDGKITLLNPASGIPWIGPVSEDGRFDMATNGNDVTALFTQSPDGQYDLFFATFDSTSGAWSDSQRLTQDGALKLSPSVAYLRNGSLFSTFARTALITQTHVVTTSAGGLVTSTVRVRGQSDLVGQSWSLARNLTAVALRVSDLLPPPGVPVTLALVIRNSGDLPAANFATTFAANGAAFSTMLITTPLAGGAALTLATVYTPPLANQATVLSATVDSTFALDESSEQDNALTAMAFGPDLSIGAADSQHWGGSEVTLRALVDNAGTGSAPTTTIVYRLEGLTGTLLVSDVVPMLAAGTSQTLATFLNLAGLPLGAFTITAEVNPGQASVSEVYTGNNSLTLRLDNGVDLMVAPQYLWVASPTSTNAVITAAIFNISVFTATDVQVAFYETGHLSAGSTLFTRTIPVIAPSSYALVSGPSPIALPCSVYVVADPAVVIADVNRGNNITSLSIGNRCATVFLPAVWRT